MLIVHTDSFFLDQKIFVAHTQQQYINLNIRGEISIIVVQVHCPERRNQYVQLTLCYAV
jgi:hypothetical protein